MMNGGYVKVYRKLLDDPIFTQAPHVYFRLAVTFLLSANWRDREWFDGRGKIVIPRGSFVTSRPAMCKLARVTARQYRDAMAYLEVVHYLTTTTTSRYTVVTITNYERYQGESGHEGPTEGPTDDQPTTTTEEVNQGRTGLHQDLDSDTDCRTERKKRAPSDGSVSKASRKPVIPQFPELRKIMFQMRDWQPNEKKHYPSDRAVCSVMDEAGRNSEASVVNLFAVKYHRHGIQPGTGSAPRSWKWFSTVLRRYLQERAQQRADDEAASDPETIWDKETGERS